ncbi:zinc finger and SCAN domain-containing protein 12-like [Cloeon dipterum]|uniref:zinc finger and SCAN domain-containing protein 12-like n=1 Tax=Cloeon dipterum TaxID=197152 RepID=UPI00321FF154
MDQRGDNNPQQFPDQNYQLQSDDQIYGNYQLWECDENFTEQTNDFAGLFPAGTEQSSNSQSNAHNYLETPADQGVGSMHVQQSQFLPVSSQLANPQPAQYDAPAQQPYKIFQNVSEMDANHASNVVPEERQQNEVALQEPSQESESQQISEPGMTGAEKNPLPGPSSEESKGRNLKRKNDRAKKETQGAKHKKKSTSTESDSDKIKYKSSASGNCGECPKRDYHANIYIHFDENHKELQRQKCTAPGCKIHFGSDQKRKDHETNEQHVWKIFHCPHCSQWTGQKSDLKTHILVRHSEKTVKCEELNCSRMFAFDADMKQHYFKDHHKMVKCPTCGKEMTVSGFIKHNFDGRCPGAAE